MGIADFNALMTLQGPTLLGDVKDVVNLIQRRTWTPSFLIGGREEAEIFKSGPTLRDTVYLEKVRSGEWYDPNGFERDERNPQIATEVEANWRYYITSLNWTRQEVMQSVPNRSSGSHISHQYKDLIFTKRQNLEQDMCDDHEEQYWRVPVQADMEGNNAVVPYSIPTFICEETHATSGIGVPTDAAGAQSWNTLMGLDVASANTNTKFDNQRLTYSAVSGNAPKGTDMIGALKRMRRRLHYKPLPRNAEYGNKESLPNVCLTSDLGMTWIEGSLRAHEGNAWGVREMQDGTLTVGGVPMEYIESLDDYAGYDAGSGLGTEATCTKTGARFYFLSKEGLCPKYFEDMFMEADEPVKDSRQPLNYVQHYHLWAQLWCRNRRTLGIVSPGSALI